MSKERSAAITIGGKEYDLEMCIRDSTNISRHCEGLTAAMALTLHILKFVNYLIAHLPFGSRNSPFIFQIDAIFCFAIGAFNSAL